MNPTPPDPRARKTRLRTRWDAAAPGMRVPDAAAGADGEDLQVEPAAFDAAVCRLGLMPFPESPQGLREMHRALRHSGLDRPRGRPYRDL